MNPEREDGPAILPDSGEEQAAAPPTGAADAERSLLTDVEDLILDAKTYFDAELSYQKSRAGFVADCLKKVIALGVIAVVLALFALVGLTVGLIIALTPHITAWGATAVVVGTMLLVAGLLVRQAGKRWGEMMDAINEGKDSE